MVRRVSTSITPGIRVVCSGSCRRILVPIPRTKMASPRGIDGPSWTVLEVIKEKTKCSGGMSRYSLMWTGFISYTNPRRGFRPRMKSAISSWACSRTTASCRIESAHQSRHQDPTSGVRGCASTARWRGAPWCTPFRGALISGRHPHQTGATGGCSSSPRTPSSRPTKCFNERDLDSRSVVPARRVARQDRRHFPLPDIALRERGTGRFPMLRC